MLIQRYEKGISSRLFDIINIMLMLFVIIATLYPLWHVAVISVSDGKAVMRGDVGLLPVDFTLDSYRLTLRDKLIVRSLWNSISYTGIGTLLNLTMTALCAYPLARPRFSGRKVFTWMIVGTMLFSGGLIPLYLVVLRVGLQNTMWAFLLPGAISAWLMFIMRTSFQQIPEDVYDAATIDGANDLQTMVRIILPMSKATFATLLLFYAVAIWNSWFMPLIFLDERTKHPIQLMLRAIVLHGRFEQAGEMGGASQFTIVEQTLKYATIMIGILPILFVYPFVQKHFVKGVMIGSIKG